MQCRYQQPSLLSQTTATRIMANARRNAEKFFDGDVTFNVPNLLDKSDTSQKLSFSISSVILTKICLYARSSKATLTWNTRIQINLHIQTWRVPRNNESVISSLSFSWIPIKYYCWLVSLFSRRRDVLHWNLHLVYDYLKSLK